MVAPSPSRSVRGRGAQRTQGMPTEAGNLKPPPTLFTNHYAVRTPPHLRTLHVRPAQAGRQSDSLPLHKAQEYAGVKRMHGTHETTSAETALHLDVMLESQWWNCIQRSCRKYLSNCVSESERHWDAISINTSVVIEFG